MPCNSCRGRAARGYSLAELLVASVSASLLVGGLASALRLSGMALSPDNASLDTTEAARVLAAVREDLRYATGIIELTENTVTVTVPDRDNDALQEEETIRYAWSGEAGDPLVYQYNEEPEIELLANVQEFELSSLPRSFAARRLDAGDGADATLLFVVSDDRSVTDNEAAQFSMFAGWGFIPELISGAATSGDLNDAAADVSVIVVSSDCSNAASVGVTLASVGVGLVCESLDAAPAIGFASGGITRSAATVAIENRSHEIIDGFAAGELTLLDTVAPLNGLSLPVAPDGTTLATLPLGGDAPTLVAVEAGETLFGGGLAPARRVMTPYGGSGFNAELLTRDGQTLLRNAIEWAASGSDSGGSGGSGSGGAAPMVQYVGVQETQLEDDGRSLTLATPTGAVGDLLIAAIAVDNTNANSLEAGSGDWNPIAIDEQGSPITLGVWWKTATAGDTDVDISWDDRSRAYGWVMRFEGQDPTAPIHATAINGGASLSPLAEAVTTTVDNCLVLRVGGFDSDDINQGDPGIAGHTAIVMNVSHSGSGEVSGGAAYAVQAAAGDTGGAAFTLTDDEQFRTVTIAIAPESP